MLVFSHICAVIVTYLSPFVNRPNSGIKNVRKEKIMLDILPYFVYYMRVGSKPTAHGEVA